jgi:uncharacterized protein (DUF2336 family)
MTPHARLLIDQFDAALGRASSAQHLAIQRQLADLVLEGAKPYSDFQRAVISGVMGRLIQRIDRRALLELSGRLAVVEDVPDDVIGQLSQSDDISVAGPVLEKSSLLSDECLLEIARAKSQDHLMAIARRARINEPVTDVLVERGNADVTRKVVANPGARLSELGFVRLVHGASTDTALAAALAARGDLPEELRPFLQPGKG